MNLRPTTPSAAPTKTHAQRERVQRTDPAGDAAFCAAVSEVDWLDRLDEIRCPTPVVAGADDVGAPAAG